MVVFVLIITIDSETHISVHKNWDWAVWRAAALVADRVSFRKNDPLYPNLLWEDIRAWVRESEIDSAEIYEVALEA